jgi:mRNA interferase MazF
VTPVPDRGDLVWLTFDPQAGREQAGRPPALVLSPRRYHARSPFTVVCPITSKVKGYPFEVVLPNGLPVFGAVLVDQIKSIDRRVRQLELAGRAPAETIEEVVMKLAPLIGLAI